MVNIEVTSKDEGKKIKTKVSVDISGEKYIVVEEVSDAIKELVKYSRELGKAEHIYIMSNLMNMLNKLQSEDELGSEDDG